MVHLEGLSLLWHWNSTAQYCLSPTEVTIGLSASISSKICELVNLNVLGYETVTNYLPALYQKFHLIWFSGHKELQIFVRYVVSPFNPSFDEKEIHTIQPEHKILHSSWNGLRRCIFKAWMEGIYDNPHKN